MKNTSESLMFSRKWAHVTLKDIELNALYFQFYDNAVEETLYWPEWKVYLRYFCTKAELKRKSEVLFNNFLES